MARQEMLMARCDRKECNTVIEIDRTTVAPKGWLQISVEIEGKWDSTSKLEFCSEKCVQLWARDRNKIVHANGNGSVPSNYRQDVLAAIDIIISENSDAVTKDSVAAVAQIESSTAGTWLRKLTDECVLEVIAGEGKRGSPFVYAKSSVS